MIVVRNIFQAKYGRGDELVQIIKDGEHWIADSGARSQRLLTDLSGRFFTVVWEAEYDSLASFETSMGRMSDPQFGQWFGRMMPLVEHGTRELYTLVD